MSVYREAAEQMDPEPNWVQAREELINLMRRHLPKRIDMHPNVWHKVMRLEFSDGLLEVNTMAESLRMGWYGTFLGAEVWVTKKLSDRVVRMAREGVVTDYPIVVERRSAWERLDA